MTPLLIGLITFFAILTQSFTGFGLALVSMPLLTSVVGLQTATPLVALISLTAEAIILARYRDALNLKAVKQIALASVFGVPVGVLILRQVNEAIILPLMGVIVAGYAIYALFGPRLPAMAHPYWANSLGFVSGVLGGAYNITGPPVIIYGHCRRWQPAEFKGNLQGFFLLNSTLVLIAHAVARNLTAPVWHDFVFTLPAIGLGALAGFALDKRVEPDRFRTIVLWLLVGVGLSLIL